MNKLRITRIASSAVAGTAGLPFIIIGLIIFCCILFLVIILFGNNLSPKFSTITNYINSEEVPDDVGGTRSDTDLCPEGSGKTCNAGEDLLERQLEGDR